MPHSILQFPSMSVETLETVAPPSMPGKGLILQENEVIGNWRVMRMLAAGGFSTVYEVCDNGSDENRSETYALKIEPVSYKSDLVMKMEAVILLQLRGPSSHVCAFMDCGRILGRLQYVVMSLVGPNLDSLRRQCPGECMQLSTVLRIAIQTIQGVQDLHEIGFIHRDIKPGNFAIGRNEDDRRIVYLLDFGLARRFLNTPSTESESQSPDEIEIRPARESCGFRGTLRYCSGNSHAGMDLGRQDDLWSLIYMFAELRTGQLQWASISDHDQVGQAKKSTQLDQLFNEDELPIFQPMYDEVMNLKYVDRPDYEWFKDHLKEMQIVYDLLNDGPFEWEEGDSTASDDYL